MTDTNTPPPVKKGRGCFFYGCMISLAAGVLAVALIVIGVLVAVHRVNALIVEYTDTTPMTLPAVDMPADELTKLKARLGEFSHALDAQTNTPPLVINTQELNALIADHAAGGLVNMSNTFHVDLTGELMKGQISLPLGQLVHIPLIHTEGRYLNGTGDFAVTVTNAQLQFSVNTLEAKGKPLPLEFKTWLEQFVSDVVNKNPTNSAALTRYDSIGVKDGTLIIKAKTQ